MNEELIDELKELAMECEVPEDVFSEIVEYALAYREQNDNNLRDEDVAEIVKESIQNYDYDSDEKDIDGNPKTKSIEEVVGLSISRLYNYDYYENKGRQI